ncbi:hypothetical protein L1049_026765 [Liquidambar formosana]|uniref:DUF632 domain-containing protein n=1 Tax=Liquidambar formosana TaxID=63359 RepID=A0AAP0NFJ4_LIQFO
MDDSPEMVVPPYYSYASPPTAWSSPPGENSYAYYMEKTPTMPSVVYEDPRGYSANGQWPETSYGYSSYPQYGNENGGFFGFSMGSPPQRPDDSRRSSPTPPPAPPSPKVSAWDFLNPFDSYDNGYPGYYSQSRYGFGSTTSSPDSKEVREREGIPDLEEETEQEMMKEARKSKKLNEEMKKNSGEGTSRAVPSQYSEGAPRAVPSQYGEGTSRAVPSQKGEGVQPEQGKEIKSSPDTIVSKSSEEEYARKKGVTFEVDGASTVDVESSKPSSLTTLSAHGTRDLQEVVKEIRDEFETASGHGREVSVLLEVGKLPYQSSGGTVFKVIFSRILYLIEPFMSSSHPPSGRSVRVPYSTMKMAKAYYGDPGKEFNVKPINLSSTLEKLYVWEKKLYKEVKDEERLRDIYEKKCKRLKVLDDRGAESNKIDATRASIKKLLAKINVNIRTIDAISSRIHKLRDEELQPQLTELIHGLIRMWKSMLKCHQKQFQAIMESKIRTLKANTGHRGDSSLRATFELEVELLNWCTHFNQWIDTQKSYVRSLNEWLFRCLHHEPEETPDGIIPFSPGRIGAPPVFIICNDWCQAMERISETGVADAMHDFALSLHQLWERQGEEQRQRIKAEYLLKDFEKRLRTFRMERGKMER